MGKSCTYSISLYSVRYAFAGKDAVCSLCIGLSTVFVDKVKERVQELAVKTKTLDSFEGPFSGLTYSSPKGIEIQRGDALYGTGSAMGPVVGRMAAVFREMFLL